MTRFAPLAALALAVAGLMAWSGSLGNGFTWDDHYYLSGNGFLKDPLGYRGAVPNAARPVWILSALLDARVWGLKKAAGPHLTSLLIHVWNAALVLGLARLLGLARGPAILSALLFAVHPLAAESVCAASFRPDLLAALGMGVAAASALKYEATGLRPWLLGTLAGAAFALGAKETALVLPLVLAAWMRRGQTKVLGLLALGALAFALWRAPGSTYRLPFLEGAQGLASADHLASWGGAHPPGTLRRIPLAAGYLLSRVLWPFGTRIDPGFPGSPPFQALAWGLLGAALWASWKLRGTPVGKAWSWTLLTALPALGLVPLPNPVADRYAYLPLMGLAIAAGPLLWRFRVPGVLLLVSFVLSSRANASAWKGDAVLWKRVVRASPGSARAWDNAGVMARTAGRARKYLERARTLAPDCPWPEAHLGALAFRQGRYREAASRYAMACRLSPSPVRWLMFARGEALWRSGRREEARSVWLECRRRFPDYGILNRRLSETSP